MTASARSGRCAEGEGNRSVKQKKDDSGWKKYEELPDYLLEPTSQAVYTYDAVGNRLSVTTDQGTTTYRYDGANRLRSAGGTEYAYDAAGNLTGKRSGEDEALYAYNAAGRLEEVTLPDESAVTYAYDALGRKVLRTESFWAAKGNPHGTPAALHASGPLALSALPASAGRFPLIPRSCSALCPGYYLTDGLGSVMDLTDQKGTVIQQYRYDAFGGSGLPLKRQGGGPG